MSAFIDLKDSYFDLIHQRRDSSTAHCQCDVHIYASLKCLQLCGSLTSPRVSLLQLDSTACKEMSVSDTEVSDVTWTDNGTFNLSEGHTPQTENSEGTFGGSSYRRTHGFKVKILDLQDGGLKSDASKLSLFCSLMCGNKLKTENVGGLI